MMQENASREVEGRLGGAVGEASNSWFRLRRGAQGPETERRAPCAAQSLPGILSPPPSHPPARALSLSNK